MGQGDQVLGSQGGLIKPLAPHLRRAVLSAGRSRVCPGLPRLFLLPPPYPPPPAGEGREGAVAGTSPATTPSVIQSDRNPLQSCAKCLPRRRRRAYDRANDKLGGKRMCGLPRTLALCLWSAPS